jgi:hypothetical protein
MSAFRSWPTHRCLNHCPPRLADATSKVPPSPTVSRAQSCAPRPRACPQLELRCPPRSVDAVGAAGVVPQQRPASPLRAPGAPVVQAVQAVRPVHRALGARSDRVRQVHTALWPAHATEAAAAASRGTEGAGSLSCSCQNPGELRCCCTFSMSEQTPEQTAPASACMCACKRMQQTPISPKWRQSQQRATSVRALCSSSLLCAGHGVHVACGRWRA